MRIFLDNSSYFFSVHVQKCRNVEHIKMKLGCLRECKKIFQRVSIDFNSSFEKTSSASIEWLLHIFSKAFELAISKQTAFQVNFAIVCGLVTSINSSQLVARNHHNRKFTNLMKTPDSNLPFLGDLYRASFSKANRWHTLVSSKIYSLCFRWYKIISEVK